jgi:hypothetical protein
MSYTFAVNFDGCETSNGPLNTHPNFNGLAGVGRHQRATAAVARGEADVRSAFKGGGTLHDAARRAIATASHAVA